jgi:hypothetical protein
MNVNELKNLVKCIPGSIVCYSNELFQHNDKSIFISMCAETGKGDHFVAFYFSENNCYYFDPLGGGSFCIVQNVRDFILSKTDKIIYNGNRIQSLSASTCGLHCAFFIFITRLYKYKDFIAIYSTRNYNENDALVVTYFLNQLKIPYQDRADKQKHTYEDLCIGIYSEIKDAASKLTSLVSQVE